MMFQPAPDKRAAILSAAFEVFINYGFRKTSMDDIARAAGMSRPALYQIFRNKAEIFRSLVLALLENLALGAKAAFDSDKPFRDRLYDAIDVSILSLHRRLQSTQHGAELIDVNCEIASDLEEKWCDWMIAAIAAGIEDAEARGDIELAPVGVDAKAVAAIVMQSMEGLKAKYLRGEAVAGDVATLVTFISGALSVKS